MKRLLRNVLFAGAAATGVYLAWLPNVALLRHQNPTTTTLMELREAQHRRKGHAWQAQPILWRDLDAISPNLVHAVIVAEDGTFYEHHGFDFDEIREAVRRDWLKRRYAYGGSTITQQLARTLYLSPSKNILRKMKEALITLQLEHHLRKRRILELYLNVVEWGNGIYGAEAASRAYFGKGCEALTTDEAIALASILPSPRRWSPLSEQAFMARRRTRLMEHMVEAGYFVGISTSAIPNAGPFGYFIPSAVQQ